MYHLLGVASEVAGSNRLKSLKNEFDDRMIEVSL